VLISLLKNGQIVVNENVLQLASHHPTNSLTPYGTHHPTTGLTPNPSPRGEGSDVLCKFMLTWQLVKGRRCKGV